MVSRIRFQSSGTNAPSMKRAMTKQQNTSRNKTVRTLQTNTKTVVKRRLPTPRTSHAQEVRTQTTPSAFKRHTHTNLNAQTKTLTPQNTKKNSEPKTQRTEREHRDCAHLHTETNPRKKQRRSIRTDACGACAWHLHTTSGKGGVLE